MKSSSNQKQEDSKHPYFARQFIACLIANNIQPRPIAVVSEFNKHYKATVAKPHTVRKWLLGHTRPKSETLLLLAKWLKVELSELISKPASSTRCKFKGR
jgi:hypothetical protein